MLSALSLKPIQNPSVWLLADYGKVGTVNQAKGLLNALGFSYDFFSLAIHPLWRCLPKRCWPLSCVACIDSSVLLGPPWPHLIVAAGTVGAAMAAKIRKLSGKKTFTIVLQNPRMDLNLFDLVVVPCHDNLQGENVIHTVGALHTVTPEKTQQEAALFHEAWDGLSQPFVAVLIGGVTRHYTFGTKQALKLRQDLIKLYHQTGCGFLLTFSRRTPPQVRRVFEDFSKDVPAFLWNGQGKNPYFAFLGIADYIIVTEDSVSMISEAAATDKPLFIYPLQEKSTKFKTFHQYFFDLEVAKPFEGNLFYWARKPFIETLEVAECVKKKLPFKTDR